MFTRLGVCGPMAAYAAFAPKEEAGVVGWFTGLTTMMLLTDVGQ